jgi:hypothetical protein
VSPDTPQFDANLRTRNPEFGLRDLQRELEPLAQQHGMRLKERIEMPAGNVSGLSSLCVKRRKSDPRCDAVACAL